MAVSVLDTMHAAIDFLGFNEGQHRGIPVVPGEWGLKKAIG